MNRTHATIFPVAGYDDRLTLCRVAEAALRGIPTLESLWRAPTPHRLVVVKPNWVQQAHEYNPDVWEPVITHPSVVLAVVDELARAMQGLGTLCVCDAPHTYADFETIVARGQLKERLQQVRDRWPRLRLELIDLRREVWIRKDEVVVERRANPHDPRGYVPFNLGRDSLFWRHRGEGHYYGADYDSGVVNAHHHGDVHEYLVAGTPIACDLFVNLPKLKTHKKTGITCSLKNLVGINGDKNWLPHHTEAGPEWRGDEYPSARIAQQIERVMKRAGRRMMASLPVVGNWLYRRMRNTGKHLLGDSETVVRNGNWHGNDTCWRMALDLNRTLLYGNSNGTWREAVAPKHYLALVDGIIGGEGNGPLCPDPVASGVLLAGTNPAVVDAVACRLMGFDPQRVPIVREAFASHRWPIADVPLDQITVLDNRLGRSVPLDELAPAIPGGFKPHFGWQVLREGN